MQQITLESDVFDIAVDPLIVAQVVRWQLNKKRQGTRSTLDRSEVRGTTRKCKPQKEQGTRHGDKRSPIFRKGGVAHGPIPTDFTTKLNKKVRALGLRMALADKSNHQQVIFVENLDLTSPKTKDLQMQLHTLGVEKALFVSDVFDANFLHASRNLYSINKLPVVGLNVYDILKYKQLVITRAGMKALEERFASM